MRQCVNNHVEITWYDDGATCPVCSLVEKHAAQVLELQGQLSDFYNQGEKAAPSESTEAETADQEPATEPVTEEGKPKGGWKKK